MLPLWGVYATGSVRLSCAPRSSMGDGGLIGLLRLLGLLLADGAATLGLFLVGGLVSLDTCQLGVYQDASAILADDNLLVHLDVQLPL